MRDNTAGAGQRLPEALRRTFEDAFGTDFSDVRVHRDRLASDHDADAVTYHRDGRPRIHLSADADRTDSRDGRRLLAHELAHVVQQRAGRVRTAAKRGLPVTDRPELETEADALAEKAAGGDVAHGDVGEPGKLPPSPAAANAHHIGTTPIQAKGKSKSWQRRRRARLEEEARQRQERKEAAATKIQSAWRGYKSRKETYPLRSLHQWAKDLAANPSGQQTEDDAYNLYSDQRPSEQHPPLTRKEQIGHISHLTNIRSQGKAFVYPQSEDEEPYPRDPMSYMLDVGPKAAGEEFAYRFLPYEDQPDNDRADSSRLTANIKPGSANAFSDVLAKTVTEESPARGGPVDEAKIMGPANIGQRTDDAVVYLRGTDPAGAQQQANTLQARTRGMRVRHAPPGMESMAPGISYAETKPGGSTSHGTERSEIVADAVSDAKQSVAQKNARKLPVEKLTTVRDELPQAVRRAIDKHGYDPDKPSRIKRR